MKTSTAIKISEGAWSGFLGFLLTLVLAGALIGGMTLETSAIGVMSASGLAVLVAHAWVPRKNRR